MAPSVAMNTTSSPSKVVRKKEITKEDVQEVKDSLRAKVKLADAKIVENRGCHICHTRAAKVILCCSKGFVSHSFCAAHVSRLWGHTLEDVEKDPSCWQLCPVCSLECPCSACKRKLKKAVRKAICALGLLSMTSPTNVSDEAFIDPSLLPAKLKRGRKPGSGKKKRNAAAAAKKKKVACEDGLSTIAPRCSIESSSFRFARDLLERVKPY
eukprot:g3639.t1